MTQQDNILVKSCLRYLDVGMEVKDLSFLRAWMVRTDELRASGISPQQAQQLTVIRREIVGLEEYEALHGEGSALDKTHPMVIAREERARRREVKRVTV